MPARRAAWRIGRRTMNGSLALPLGLNTVCVQIDRNPLTLYLREAREPSDHTTRLLVLSFRK